MNTLSGIKLLTDCKLEVISIAFGQILLRSTAPFNLIGLKHDIKSLHGDPALANYDISFKIDNTIYLRTSVTIKKASYRKYL